MNLALVVAVSLLTAMFGAIGYWWYRKNKPIHNFIGVDFGAGSVQPKRIKNLYGPFKVKRNDGQKVTFPVPQGFQHHRQDGRGTMFFGDLNTGQLLRMKREGNLFEAVHGVFMEHAFSDGRVQAIVAATKGNSGIKLEHVAILVGVTLLAVIVSIYMYARNGGVA